MSKIVQKCPECGKIAKAISFKDIPLLGRLTDLECGHVLQGDIIAQEFPESRDSFWNLAREYQQEAVEFIEKSNFSCLIADEMGLGKTIEALLAIRYNKESLIPVIFIVKSSVKYNWAQEILKWLVPSEPSDKASLPSEPADMPFILHDGSSMIFPGFRYYILSMSMLPKVLDELKDLKPRLLVVDESHHFKSMKTARTRALMELCESIEHKIYLSGTPILNRASEYFPTLNSLRPTEWYSERSFLSRWVQFNYKNQPGGIKPYKKQEFFDKTSTYILRRTKSEVLKDLPEFSRNFRVISIEDEQYKTAYNRQAGMLKNYMDSAKDSSFVRAQNILAYLSKMRQITGVAKTPIIAEEIKEFLSLTDTVKLAVGIHHKIVAKMLSMSLAEYNPIMISGSDGDEQKFKKLNAFREPKSRLSIISVLASGEGLNIQFCSNAIVAERQWNTAKEIQFEDRFHRFGQENPVVVDYYIAKGTIDEWLTQLVLEKRGYVASATDRDSQVEDTSYVSVPIEELANLSTRRI